MQKWQQKQRQKAHQSIIQNAKSSLRRYSNSRQKSMNTSRARPIPYPQPHSQYSQQNQQVPINKILQIFQLQEYNHLLSMHRFANNLATLQENSTLVADMLLHVKDKDKERFASLLHTLIIMSKSINIGDKNSRVKPQPSKASICYPPQHSSATTNKTPSSIPKSNNSQSKFRIKTKAQNSQTPKMQKNKKQEGVLSGHQGHSSVQREVYKKQAKIRKKSLISNQKYPKTKANDDLTLIHTFQLDQKDRYGKLSQIEQKNKIIRKLMQKLQKQNRNIKVSKQKQIDDINLDMKKIQQMYLSYDSATLTSNITNIDLQHINLCLAMEIVSLLASYQVEELAKTNQGKIRSLLRESFIIVREEERESRTQLDSLQECEPKQQLQKHQLNSQYLQQHISGIQVSTEHHQQTIQNYNDNGNDNYNQAQVQAEDNINQITESGEQEQEQNPQHVQIKLRDKDNGMMESSIWGNNYIASVIQDFSCFDTSSQLKQIWEKQPRIEDVKNFIDLVMMAGKMQKQIPILAHVYINRLLKKSPNSKLSKKNWKNITLISLIQASKIWDDRSLQNNSFSKVIKPYTTLQINRLQKYLLFFIDYKLNINKKEYSESYFNLRKHSGNTCHTVNLIKLDLKTIHKLQQIQQKGDRDRWGIQKKEFMSKCMNKSF